MTHPKISDKSGHCPVARTKVTCPPELGGLGISSLQQLGWTLKMRWLWLQKTEPDKPWATFPIEDHVWFEEWSMVASWCDE
jgi:hypothetical protein